MGNPIRPSRLKYYARCPRWKPQEKEPTVAKEAAAEGQLLHRCMETGESPEQLTDEQRESLAKCARYESEALARSMGRGNAPILHRYAEVHMRILDDPLIEGTPDKIIVLDEVGRGPYGAHLFDYKFGMTEIEDVTENWQLQSYAVAAFRQFPTIRWVVVHILCPRQAVIYKHRFTRSQVPMLTAKLAALGDRVADTSIPPTGDAAACLRCGARATCPVFVRALAPLEPMIPVESLASIEVRDPQAISDPVVMARGMMLTSVLEDWIPQYRREMTRKVVEEGINIPGYQLIVQEGRSKMGDVMAAFNVAAEVCGLSAQEFLAFCTINLENLDKAVASKAQKGEIGATQAKVRQTLEEAGVTMRGPPIRFLKKMRATKK